jgi:BirA family transcriptional regulator, biotin operon repressor / biotin---[acetyl-CoA-carboxylase] ligase
VTTAADLTRALAEGGVDAPARWHEVVGSTNAEALEWAEAGAPEFALVCAGHQAAGRGRRGRTWEDLPGRALMFSFVLRPEGSAEAAGLLTLLAGAAMAEAASALAGVDIRCKWPNDLTLGSAKVGGILAESSVSTGSSSSAGPWLDHVVIGVGVNLDAPPTVAGAAALGDRVDPMELLSAFIGRFRTGYTPTAPGFATAVADRWKEVSATLGSDVEARFADGTRIRGRAADIDESGGLVLEREGERTVIHSGEVVHLR